MATFHDGSNLLVFESALEIPDALARPGFDIAASAIAFDLSAGISQKTSCRSREEEGTQRVTEDRRRIARREHG